MAGWKENGFVPDSDDEGDSQESAVQEVRATSYEGDDKGEDFSNTHDSRVDGKGGKPIATGHGRSGNNLEALVQKPAERTTAARADDIDELQQDHYIDAPGEQLQSELAAHIVPQTATQTALLTHKDVSQTVSHTTSRASSILSDPPSSLPDLLTLLEERGEIENGNGEPSLTDPRIPHSSLDLALAQVLDSGPDRHQPQETGRLGRTFRHRNAIQLHPYVVEKEKYNQAWRARGLKPVHILQEEAARAYARKEDSQNFEVSEAEDGPSSSPPVPERVLSTSQSPRQGSIPAIRDDEEFPDINALLHGSSRGFTTSGQKRRKKNPKFKRPPVLTSRERIVSPSHRGHNSADDNDESYDVPPSPPLSGSRTPVEGGISSVAWLHALHHVISPSLPTPLTSSVPRKRHPRAIILDDDSNEQPSDENAPNEASETSSASSEEGVTYQLQRAQRRIKGVLPASWLKLDLRTQVKRPQQDRAQSLSISPERPSNQRGVARPVLKKGRKIPRLASREETFVLSDNDSIISGVDGEELSQPCDNSVDLFADDASIFTSRLGEAMEDDTIDAMLPPMKRARLIPKQPQRYQTKMRDFGIQSTPVLNEPGKRISISGTQQARTTNKLRNSKAKPKVRVPRLSVLDGLGSQGIQDDTLPAFIKVARRTARSRNDKGRHSPTRKVLQLASREDTHDATQMLQGWREGIIAPSVIHATVARQPLHPRSANNATAPSKPFESATTLRRPRIVTAGRNTISSRPRTTRQSTLQSSLDSLVWRQRPETPISTDSLGVFEHDLPRADVPRRRGQLLSGLQTTHDSRPAMLESSQMEQDRLHPRSAFRRGLCSFDRINYENRISGPVLDRFLNGEGDHLETVTAAHNRHGNRATESKKPKNKIQTKPARYQKRRPKHLDVAVFQSRELTSPALVDELQEYDAHMIAHGEETANVLIGLGPFGTRYTTTFDVIPLPQDISFHKDSFLGSGDFKKSLALRACSDLDRSRGYSLITRNGVNFRWGAWNETVSTELVHIFELIKQGTRSLHQTEVELDAPTELDSITLQTAIISYFSTHLSFSDPVDRLSFLQSCKNQLSAVWDECIQSVANAAGSTVNVNAKTRQNRIQISALHLVLWNQLLQISKHGVVPQQLRDELQFRVATSAKQTYAAIGTDLEAFEHDLIRCGRVSNAEHVIHADESAIEAFVMTHHVLGRANIHSLEVLDLVQDVVPAASADQAIDIGSCERAWQNLFVLLPFLEINDQGLLEAGTRFKTSLDNWTIVKRFVSPILETYIANPQGQAPGFNAYCRSAFSRCLHLINGWGWYRCDSIIGFLFDFFAKNSLGHLRNEESRGSPSFLENLDANPALNAEPEDRCFHLLLKIIGSGLKHMHQLYPPKKIRDLVWRLMPNHGRSHPKEHAIHQQDLDALRNHHDLLCTLYWASPPGFRPSLNAIRTLVDLERSHREACHISIRAWSNLVQFQLSTIEPTQSLELFSQWHTDFLQQILRQHNLARTEAEDHIRSAQYVSPFSVSKESLEFMITKNQRQVEAVLSDALVRLEMAVKTASTREAAGLLLSPAITGVFDLFDSSAAQASRVIGIALDVLLAYTTKCQAMNQQTVSTSHNDDSQEYGDWSAFNEDDGVVAKSTEYASTALQQIAGPLRNLLSNCFGADVMPQESLLTKLIDTWVAVSRVLVNDGVKSWDDYLGQFGSDAWSTLRDTDQARKYATYFFATFTETDAHVYHGNRASILACWMGALVERESLLKFQHKLTNALLNRSSDDPLLCNPPFWKSLSTGRFEITATEFSKRRISLISSLLSNMRVSLETAYLDLDTDTVQLKQEYKDLLKHLMTTMKHNYSELGQGSNVKGAYVNFVQRVVELLQEHTSSICPVDRFFTDSAAFPLPTTDPNYVVGQLKNYGLRLRDSKTPKQLAVFLQSVSERAASDGEQAYLVEQLQMAMSNSFEDGSAKPTLRAFLVKAIVPAYVQMAFRNSIGWVLAMPFLQALQNVFGGIHLDLEGCNLCSVDSVRSTLSAFLACTCAALAPIVDQPSYLESASVQKTLAACYRVISALLPTLDFALHLVPRRPDDPVLDYVAFFKDFSKHAHAFIAPMDSTEPPMNGFMNVTDSTVHTQYTDINSFTVHELQDTLRKNWTRVGDDYYVTRNSLRRRIRPTIGCFEDERDAFRLALHDFGACLSTLPALGGWEEWREIAARQQNMVGCAGLLF